MYALIFDFDGLIADTETIELAAWQRVFEAFGAAISVDWWVTLIGTADYKWDPIDDIHRQTGSQPTAEVVWAMQKDRKAELLKDLRLMPGVEELIGEAQCLGLRVGLASSSSRAWVTGHLERFGLLEHFECLCTRDDVSRTKPDPELFLLALDRLGVESSRAIVLEDSAHGITAARAAGIYTIAVPNELTRRSDLSHANESVGSLEELDLREVVGRLR